MASLYATDKVRIDFPDDFRDGQCVSTGRNGELQTTALDVLEDGENRISFIPVTSRGQQGRCRIEIARDSETLKTLAQALLRFDPKELRIEFPDEFRTGECLSLGRNGDIQTVALDVYGLGDDLVVFAPVTSRGKQARCRIEVPRRPSVLENLAGTLLRMAAQD
jgi:hypothetical protein